MIIKRGYLCESWEGTREGLESGNIGRTGRKKVFRNDIVTFY